MTENVSSETRGWFSCWAPACLTQVPIAVISWREIWHIQSISCRVCFWNLQAPVQQVAVSSSQKLQQGWHLVRAPWTANAGKGESEQNCWQETPRVHTDTDRGWKMNPKLCARLTWGVENSSPVSLCFIIAAFPGMFLASTGISKSIA